MLEIEQKFAVEDTAALAARLAAWAPADAGRHDEEDHYLNLPHRSLADTDEVFRLRRIGPANFLTYKGPKQPGPVKVRAEMELPLADGVERAGDYLRLFTALGFRPVAVVRKVRQTFRTARDGFDVTVCLDDVAGVGTYAEVEVLAEPADLDRARGVVAALAAELGLTRHEPRSYLALVLERGGAGA